MKHFKEVTTERVVSTTCDMCENTTDLREEWAFQEQNGTGYLTTKIWAIQRFLEYGHHKEDTTVMEVDLCNECFYNEFLQWLEGKGVSIKWEKE